MGIKSQSTYGPPIVFQTVCLGRNALTARNFPFTTSEQGGTTPQLFPTGQTQKRALTASRCQGWDYNPGPDTESRFYALSVSVLPVNNHPQIPSMSLEDSGKGGILVQMESSRGYLKSLPVQLNPFLRDSGLTEPQKSRNRSVSYMESACFGLSTPVNKTDS